MKRNEAIPERLQQLFWDVEWKDMDLDHNRTFIIERVLNMGDDFAFGWIREMYSDCEILQVVKESRRLSKKTARCWQNYFGLKEEDMRCFGIFSMSPDNYY